ncbi:hypothetical protein [Cystobacter ferrugineus]|uniref:Uncharacterized protein n=1 Tax=Cystobacter ferrugineus TaxID=83449 RepID=A0A1L9BKJ6_9BACT|nr:hypothetical protein [Cystobacter ferrugineus]OJH42801.1 hypothetical protein BON30_06410 [Cystobacter ferrugineus]
MCARPVERPRSPSGYTPVQHDQHQTIGSQLEKDKVGDQNELIYRDKNLTVHRHHQEHIGGDMKLRVGPSKRTMVWINSQGTALDGSGVKPLKTNDAAQALPTPPTPADNGAKP